MNYFLTKVFLCILIIFYSLVSLVHSSQSGKNIALGRPYSVVPLPNYPLSAPSTDRKTLTDGIYTTGYFWTQKSTVGWQKSRRVEITIDLEKIATIGTISFNTARSESAGVFFPSHIAAFVGPDLQHLSYVGDVASSVDNQPGTYRAKRFLLEDIETKGRYVLLEIVPAKNGNVFCDEIEVYEGSWAKAVIGSLKVESARDLAEKMRRLDIEKELLNRLAKQSGAADGTGPIKIERQSEMEQRIASLSSIDDAYSIESDILAHHGRELRVHFPQQQTLIQPVNPWSPISPISPAVETGSNVLSLVMSCGGYSHAAFSITNLVNETRQVFVTLGEKPAGGPQFSLAQIPFVKSASFEYVADPLLPLQGVVTLRPGESRLIFLTAQGVTAGTWHTSVKIDGAGNKSVLPVECYVANVSMPKKYALNSVNWGYLTFKTISSRRKQAVKDLFDHHTNVIVVPPSYLPGANQLKKSQPDDFVRLESYLKLHKGAEKILLCSGFGGLGTSSIDRKSFRDRQWQERFKNWYTRIVRIADTVGFAEGQLYLYPYDEMLGKQVDDFVELASWARTAIPTIKFYATLGSLESERALPFLQIAQVPNDENMLNKFDSASAELWLYDTKGPAKSLSPYAYYRLMAWKAFLLGYTGVGFWAYADAGWGDNPGTAWDDFDGEQADFAVIYEGEGDSIVSSRRWEAWRMGIEDYELLTMYAKAKGDKVAKELAALVLVHPTETTRADEVRRRILYELSGSFLK